MARIRDRRVAFLYEKKSCEWNRKKAREALGQIENTIDDLRSSGKVDPGCTFSRFIVRIKDRPGCSTDGTATAMVQARGVNFLAGSSDEGRRAIEQMDRLGAV